MGGVLFAVTKKWQPLWYHFFHVAGAQFRLIWCRTVSAVDVLPIPPKSKLMLVGLTTKPVNELLPLAKSWISPPKIETSSGGFRVKKALLWNAGGLVSVS